MWFTFGHIKWYDSLWYFKIWTTLYEYVACSENRSSFKIPINFKIHFSQKDFHRHAKKKNLDRPTYYGRNSYVLIWSSLNRNITTDAKGFFYIGNRWEISTIIYSQLCYFVFQLKYSISSFIDYYHYLLSTVHWKLRTKYFFFKERKNTQKKPLKKLLVFIMDLFQHIPLLTMYSKIEHNVTSHHIAYIFDERMKQNSLNKAKISTVP